MEKIAMNKSKALNSLLADMPLFQGKEGQYVLEVILLVPSVRAALQQVKVGGLLREQRHLALITTMIRELEKASGRGSAEHWATLLEVLKKNRVAYLDAFNTRCMTEDTKRIEKRESQVGNAVNDGVLVGTKTMESSETKEVSPSVKGKRGRPKLSDAEKSKAVTIQLPHHLWLAVEMVATEEAMSVSSLTRKALSQYIHSRKSCCG